MGRRGGGAAVRRVHGTMESEASLVAPQREPFDYMHASDTRRTADVVRRLMKSGDRPSASASRSAIFKPPKRTIEERVSQMLNWSVQKYAGNFAALPQNIRADTIDDNMTTAFLETCETFIDRAEAKRSEIDAKYNKELAVYNQMVKDRKREAKLKAEGATHAEKRRV